VAFPLRLQEIQLRDGAAANDKYHSFQESSPRLIYK
jgi:hypothetical protein